MAEESFIPYCLEKLFSGDNDKIVIPDLQRDYCWGNSENDLVGRFIDTILALDKSKPITMGLIYGYVNKKINPSHKQLCDGQQRLTTLFLLLGMINRHSSGQFSKLLMSDFERNDDDQEPYLLYAIRESSLYFLSDLTYHFFLDLRNSTMKIQDLEKQPWFLQSYLFDPTVKSILKALKRIEEKLEGLREDEYPSLGSFVSNKLIFLYYDMENRQNGEETFVVINTTGESLSSTQNLKPIIIRKSPDFKSYDGLDAAKIWEQMETWFWRNRNRNNGEQHTADEGMLTFLQCALLLEEYFTDIVESSDRAISEDDESVPEKLSARFKCFGACYNLLTNPSKRKEAETIKFDKLTIKSIYETFLAYKKLYEGDYSERYDGSIRYANQSSTACRFTQNQLYSILPSLAFLRHFPDADPEDQKRIYHLFHNMSTYIDLSRPLEPTIWALMSVQEMTSRDVFELINAKSFSRYKGEIRKLNLIKNTCDQDRSRLDVEYVLANAEKHPILKGNKNIDVLLEWGEDNYSSIDKYIKAFNAIWICQDGRLGNLDLLRRALLAQGVKGYPLDNCSLCDTCDEWYKFITSSMQDVKGFVDKVNTVNCNEAYDGFIKTYLENNDHANENLFYLIVKDPEVLAFCTRKRVYVHKYCVEVMSKIYHSADYRIIYNGVQYDTNLGVGFLRYYSDTILYVDFRNFNLTVDFEFKEGSGYKITVWTGKMKEKPTYHNLEKLSAPTLNLQKTNEKGDIAYVTPIIAGHQKAHDKLKEIIDALK